MLVTHPIVKRKLGELIRQGFHVNGFEVVNRGGTIRELRLFEGAILIGTVNLSIDLVRLLKLETQMLCDGILPAKIRRRLDPRSKNGDGSSK